MPTPQQPELRRSERVDHMSRGAPDDPEVGRRPGDGGLDQMGPVPEENRPGHHGVHDQDKPDLDDFAARLGITPGDDADGGRTGDAEADAPAAPTVGGAPEPPDDADVVDLTAALDAAPDGGLARARQGVDTTVPVDIDRHAPTRRRGPVVAVVRVSSFVVLEPWIRAGRLAERLEIAIHRRLSGRR